MLNEASRLPGLTVYTREGERLGVVHDVLFDTTQRIVSALLITGTTPRLVKGGVLLMDDYGKFPGETKAVDDYFSGTSYELQRFPFSDTPTFIVRQ